MLIGPLSAHFFQVELAKFSNSSEPSNEANLGYQSDRQRQDRKQKDQEARAALYHKLDERNPKSDAFKEKYILERVLKGNLQHVKFSLSESLTDLLTRCFRKCKGSRRIQRLADFKTAQLDLSSLISTQMTLKDYLRYRLTDQEKMLLMH